MLRLNSGLAARLKESLQSFVPNSTDHKGECNLSRYGLQEAERGGYRRATTDR